MRALDYSKKPKMEIKLLARMETKDELSLAYTPGIAKVCKEIIKDEKAMHEYSFKRNSLAVISEGSAVLGLGNIGHKASYPVMEGKAMLLKKFGKINAIPLVVKTQNPNEFINVVKNIADSFGAINLEDIKAPECFEIEKTLIEEVDIPLMHDDQHGTAIVVLAGVINALKLLPKNGLKTKFLVCGAGAAGTAVAKILTTYGFKNVLVCDSKGILSKDRKDLNKYKINLMKITNPENVSGGKEFGLKGVDVFIGVSKVGQLNQQAVKLMNEKPVLIVMANPEPEILPKKAYEAGAGIVATGRSDFDNQVNNALAFPGLFRGAMDARVKITEELKIETVKAIVDYQQKSLRMDNLMPSILDSKIHQYIAKRVYGKANESKR